MYEWGAISVKNSVEKGKGLCLSPNYRRRLLVPAKHKTNETAEYGLNLFYSVAAITEQVARNGVNELVQIKQKSMRKSTTFVTTQLQSLSIYYV